MANNGALAYKLYLSTPPPQQQQQQQQEKKKKKKVSSHLTSVPDVKTNDGNHELREVYCLTRARNLNHETIFYICLANFADILSRPISIAIQKYTKHGIVWTAEAHMSSLQLSNLSFCGEAHFEFIYAGKLHGTCRK